MSYTFKIETKSLHAVNGKEPLGVEIEVCFDAYWDTRKEEISNEIEYIYDCDNGGELYPDEVNANFKLSELDWKVIEEKIDRICEENFGDIHADSYARAIDQAIDALEDR